MKKKVVSAIIMLAMLVQFFAFVSIAAEPLLLKEKEITLYYIEGNMEGVFPFPDELKVEKKIEVLNKEPGETITYKSSSNDLIVDSNGVLSSALWYITEGGGLIFKSSYSEEYDYIGYRYGTYTVTVEGKDRSETVTVNIVNYQETYIENELDRIADDIMAKYSTDMDRLDAICKWVASFDYDYRYQGPGGYILYGGGDCWASTNSIVELAERCGMRARWRTANRDPGAGSGHANAVVEVNGVPCIAEAGYGGEAPRPYGINEYPTGFMTTNVGATEVKIHDYIGFDSEVVVPATLNSKKVVAIGEQSFSSSGIKKITVSEGISKLEVNSFYSCTDLEEVILPSTIDTILSRPFNGDAKLTNLVISPENPYFKFEDMIIYSKDGTKLISCLRGKSGEVIIPDTVTSMTEAAFFNCMDITKIVFSKNIKEIPEGTCYPISSLEVIISEGTESIANHVFGNSSNVRVEIPESVKTIGDEAFRSAYNPVIIGYPGSFAETYAKAKNITFIDITKSDKVIMRINNPNAIMGGKLEPINAEGSKPVFINGRTMIPLRFTSESLGAEVEWIDETHEIIITKGNVRLELKRGSNKGKKIVTNVGSQASQEEFDIDSPPTFDQGRIVLPLRVIGENLGCFVHWDDPTHLIIVSEKEVPEAELAEEIIEAKRLYEIN